MGLSPDDGAHARRQDRSSNSTPTASPKGRFPLSTGGCFNLWRPGLRDAICATARSQVVTTDLRAQAEAPRVNRSISFHGLHLISASELPCDRPRIAFRDVTNGQRTRDRDRALAPARHGRQCTARPHLFESRRRASTEAFLRESCRSIPFDWYARRMRRAALTFELLEVQCPFRLTGGSPQVRLGSSESPAGLLRSTTATRTGRPRSACRWDRSRRRRRKMT